MKHLKNAAWWLCFTICAICVQALIPGLDAMVVGIIILLQEDDYRDMVWLAPLFLLLQEGMGTRPFGGIVVWYATVAIIFKIGRWLFQTENALFMFLLSTCTGAAYYCLSWLLDPLQNLPFNMERTLEKSLLEAIAIPPLWWIAKLLRPSAPKEDDKH